MNKYFQFELVVLFLISMCLLLNLYLEISYLTISILVSFGVLSGTLSTSFMGYIIPNKMIRGLLLLSNNSLSFYSGINGESIFEIALKDVNPII